MTYNHNKFVCPEKRNRQKEKDQCVGVVSILVWFIAEKIIGLYIHSPAGYDSQLSAAQRNARDITYILNKCAGYILNNDSKTIITHFAEENEQ